MMNKTRIIGLLILVAAIIVQFLSKNDLIGFISAIFIGVGMGLLIAGKLRK